MAHELTGAIAEVDPSQLEQIYQDHSQLFYESETDESITLAGVLETVLASRPHLSDDECPSLFLRLWLAVQMVMHVDTHWEEFGMAGTRPEPPPSSYFFVAAKRPAKVEFHNGIPLVDFADNILADVLSALRPN